MGGSLWFERCHSLPQSHVFNHEVGSPLTHRTDHTGMKSDEEHENMEHSGGVWLFGPVISSRRSFLRPG